MAHPDLDDLLNALLPSAKRMLDKHGEFYPFGVTLDDAGDVAIVHAPCDDEYPEIDAVVSDTLVALRQQAAGGHIRAVGLCINAVIQPPGSDEETDAIATRLEHVEGEAVSVFLPYARDDFGKMVYGDMFATPEDPTLFEANEGHDG